MKDILILHVACALLAVAVSTHPTPLHHSPPSASDTWIAKQQSLDVPELGGIYQVDVTVSATEAFRANGDAGSKRLRVVAAHAQLKSRGIVVATSHATQAVPQDSRRSVSLQFGQTLRNIDLVIAAEALAGTGTFSGANEFVAQAVDQIENRDIRVRVDITPLNELEWSQVASADQIELRATGIE